MAMEYELTVIKALYKVNSLITDHVPITERNIFWDIFHLKVSLKKFSLKKNCFQEWQLFFLHSEWFGRYFVIG